MIVQYINPPAFTHRGIHQRISQGKVMLEEYAREHIYMESVHLAEVDKMLRKPGDIERFAK